MANPQTEDGYTAIANEIMEALIAADLSGQEFRIALLVIRKTYGFKKKEDAISLSQMKQATGMHHIRCSQVVNRLQLMKILTVTENINGVGKKYSFNKDFETWDTVKENINRKGFVKGTVNVLRNRPLKKTASTKEKVQKKSLQKKTPLPPKIPAWVQEAVFTEYQASRKKKLRPASFKKFFAKLQRLSIESRASPEDILNQSIENGWEGIFKLKNDNGTGKNKHAGIKEWLDQQGVGDGAEGQKEIRGADGGDG